MQMFEIGRSNFLRQMPKTLPLAAMCILAMSAGVRASERSTRVAVLDFGDSQTARRAVETLVQLFAPKAVDEFQIVDREQARAAANGTAFTGSLNLTREEARDLGAA